MSGHMLVVTLFGYNLPYSDLTLFIRNRRGRLFP